MTNLKWYFTSLLVASREAAGRILPKWYHCLLTAINHDEAYVKATNLGRQWEDWEHQFKGIGKLLLVHETPKDGAELLWSQEEMSLKDLEALLRGPKKTREVAMPSRSGWYLGSVVLCEVHDEGSHGDRVLVWINSYLIRAMTFESAYEKSGQLGIEQQDEPGSHLCDGQKAHWEFKGVEDVIPLHDAPGDGSLLWSEELTTTAAELERLIPSKGDLGVFKWEEAQFHRE